MKTQHVAMSLVAALALAGPAHAETLGWQQPYFTYSPGAAAFESIEWTPLDFAAFSAYGGYFANVRQPQFETPLPQFLPSDSDLGIDDELRLSLYGGSTFQMDALAGEDLFAMAFTQSFQPLDISENATAIPEPGALALIGLGLVGMSRALRRRITPAPRSGQ